MSVRRRGGGAAAGGPPPPPTPSAARSAASSRPAAWLLLAPALTALALAVAPRLRVGEIAAGLGTFAGGAVVALAPLAAAAPAALRPRTAAAIAAAAGAALGAVALTQPSSPWAIVLVNAALAALGHSVGSAIGRRVAHPGHLLPACMVAAAADVLSVVHPAGPTHAMVRSERALSVIAVHFPIPGTTTPAPVLGLGDLVFVSLVLGTAAAHALSRARAIAAAALGVALAGALSAALQAPVPALVTIAAATVALLPESRRLRPADRRTTAIAATLAAGLLASVLLQRFVLR